MKLKAVSGTIRMLLFIGVLSLAFDTQLASSEPTIIIVPDDYERIQWAINNASVGTTIFVKAGTYYENVVVDKTISLVGENRTTTVIDGNRTALKNTIFVTSGNVLIANLTIRNAYYSGVKLDFYSSYNTIADNNITNNDDGIVLQSSSKNKILYNNIENNTWNGIFLVNMHACNEVIGNTIKNNHNGINSYDIDRVEANTFFHNNFINNKRQVIYYYSDYQDIWHSGYPSGGNYWSDYNGTDFYSGRYQNETGSDGIGDSPYIVNAKNKDRYPLINPHTLPDMQLIYNEFYKLLANYAELKSSYDNLDANYNNLSTQYNSLQAELNDLQSKYSSLTNELNITRNIIYALAIATVIFIATTVHFAIRKPKIRAELETT